MKKHLKPWALLLAQAAVFYLLPPLARPLGAIGTVLALLLSTFVLALLMGRAEAGKIRWLYPLFTAAVFAPSVFLYYNSSALVHTTWYFVLSGFGLILGMLTGNHDGPN